MLFDADETFEKDLADSLTEYGSVVSCDRYAFGKKDFAALAANLGKINSKSGKVNPTAEQHTVSVIMLKLEKPEYTLENPKNPIIAQTAKIRKLIKNPSFSDKYAMAYISDNFGQNNKTVKELCRFLPANTDAVALNR